MRRVTSVAAAMLVASAIQFSTSPLVAQDRVAGIISATRKALGGEDKIAGLKTLTAEGPFRRSMGGRDMEGTVTVTLGRPDKMHRLEEMQMGGMVGGPEATDHPPAGQSTCARARCRTRSQTVRLPSATCAACVRVPPRSTGRATGIASTRARARAASPGRRGSTPPIPAAFPTSCEKV